MKKLKYLPFLILSSILLTGCTNSEEIAAQYNSYVREGDTWYEQREYAQAMNKYDEAAQLLPKEEDAYKGMVNVLVDKGRLDDASLIMDEVAIGIDKGERSKLYTIIANAYYADSQWDRAEKYYLEANDGVDNLPAQLGLAKAYIKKGQPAKAEEYLDVTDASLPTFYESSLLRGYLAGASSDLVKGQINGLSNVEQDDTLLRSQYESLLATAAKLGTDELFNATLVSMDYINAGYPYLAIEALSGYKEKMSEYGDGWYFLGRAYFDHAKYSDAIESLSQASSLGVYSADVYTLMARSYYLSGDVDLATDFYDRAIGFAAENEKEDIYMEYIDILIVEQQMSKAKGNLDAVAAIADSSWIQLGYIEMYHIQGNQAKMRFHLDELATLELDDRSDYLYWEIVYNLENQETEPVPTFLAELKEIDKFGPEYYLLSGRLAFALENNDDAKSMWEKAIEYDLVGEVTESAKKLLARVN